MDQLIATWVTGFSSWSTLALVIFGICVGLLNVVFNFVDRNRFFAKIIYYYSVAAAIVALPLLGMYLFGESGFFFGMAPFFAFGPILLLLHPKIISLLFGLLVATIARDTYFKSEN